MSILGDVREDRLIESLLTSSSTLSLKWVLAISVRLASP